MLEAGEGVTRGNGCRPQGTEMANARIMARWGLVVLVGMSLFGASSTAAAFDADLLKGRLTPRLSDMAVRPAPEPVPHGDWQGEEADLIRRNRQAKKLSQSVLVDHLEELAKDTPLESIERLRRTDLKLGGEGSSPQLFGRKVDFSLRISEQLRLRVASGDFQRDLLYDPIDERVWVDLWQSDIPETRTGLRLTNSYRLDNASTNLILRIDHQLK